MTNDFVEDTEIAELEALKKEFSYAVKAWKAEEVSWYEEEDRLYELIKNLVITGNRMAVLASGMLDSLHGEEVHNVVEDWNRTVAETKEQISLD